MNCPVTDPGPGEGRRRGFTLIETMLALGVSFIVIAGAFGIVTACLELGDSVKTSQAKHDEAATLEELLRYFFVSLPEHAAIELKTEGSRPPYQSRIRVSEGPPLGRLLSAGPNETLALYTSEEAGGYLRLNGGLSSGAMNDSRPGNPVGYEIVRQVARCEWRFFRPQSNEWVTNWPANYGRPRFVELTFAQGTNPPERWVFPVPVISGGGGVPGGGVLQPPNPDNPVDPDNPDPDNPQDPEPDPEEGGDGL